jgi:hypoxanthine phosphoribosyltransferase
MSDTIQIHDKEFKIFIPSEYIEDEVKSLAQKLEKEYQEKNPIFLVVLNGAFMFAADLLKNYSKSCDISFIKLSSYQGMNSSGKVEVGINFSIDVENRHVIIVEDIVDTGLTIQELKHQLKNNNPASIEVCTLLFKPEAFRGIEPPKFQGFVISNTFVLGYGLDYNERGRNLKDLYQLKE